MEIRKVNVPNSLMAATGELSNCKLAEMRISTPCETSMMPDRVVHTSNRSCQEAGAKQSRVQGKPGVVSKENKVRWREVNDASLDL